MNISLTSRVFVCGLFISAGGLSGTASAVNLRTIVLPIYQVGTGATVSLGHTAIASTNYNRLFVGGTYSASCASPDMGTMTGQNFGTGENLVGGLSFNVTIPEWIPARVNMSGFNAAATRGQRLNCTYNWTSRAVESGYTIGAGGISFQTGNGERSEGGTQLFSMSVPALTDVNEGGSCIP
jgi:hypothetical protein